MNLKFTEEQRMIIDGVRDFAQGEIAPRAQEMDEKAFAPPEILEQMNALGLFGAGIPEEYGGIDVDSITYVGLIEELSRACAAVAIIIGVHSSVAAYPLRVFGTPEQKERFLPGMAAGKIGAFCLSEPAAGSDAASLTTAALRDGDDYVLNGQKVFVTNASLASYFLVLARTDPDQALRHKGISAFLVEKDAPGLTLGRKEDKMGLRASETFEVFLEDCRVPAANRLGEEGEGFKVAMSSLDNGRIGVGAQALGIAQAAFDEALAYAKVREQFGKPLTHFQAIQGKLSEMATRIAAARLLVHKAAWMKDQGLKMSRNASYAKLFATETATWVAHQALQIHGGYGYMKEYPVERYYRDVRVLEIYEGTSEMQRIVISRSVLGE